MEFHKIEYIFTFPVKNDTGQDLPSGNQKYYLKNVSFLNNVKVRSIKCYGRGQLGPGATKNINGNTLTIITIPRMSLYLNIVTKNDELIIQNFPLGNLTGNQEGVNKKVYEFKLDNINWEKCFISGTPQSYAWLKNEGFLLQVSYIK